MGSFETIGEFSIIPLIDSHNVSTIDSNFRAPFYIWEGILKVRNGSFSLIWWKRIHINFMDLHLPGSSGMNNDATLYRLNWVYFFAHDLRSIFPVVRYVDNFADILISAIFCQLKDLPVIKPTVLEILKFSLQP